MKVPSESFSILQTVKQLSAGLPLHQPEQVLYSSEEGSQSATVQETSTKVLLGRAAVCQPGGQGL